MADAWRTPDVEALLDAVVRLEDRDEVAAFLRDLCTLGELRDLAQRWAVVRLLRPGSPLRRDLQAHRREHRDDHPDRLVAPPRRGRLPGDARRSSSTAGVSLEQPLPPRRSSDERAGCGSPSPTRAASSSRRCALLHDAGLVFEEHDRSLVARVQNFPLDILFVRTNDVIEFVGDGVADLGITGIDLLTETGAELPQVRELGYGRCRLAAAVPTDTPDRSIADLAGLRVATAHPNTARRFFADAAHRGRRHPDLRRGRGRPTPRPRRRDRRPRVDRLDPGHERPAPDRRRPRVRGDPRRQPDGPASERAGELDRASTRCSARSSPRAAGST